MPWRRTWQPTPVFLPGESHGGRSLVGYNPQGRKESDTTELLHTYIMNYTVHCGFMSHLKHSWVHVPCEARLGLLDGITDSTDMSLSKPWEIVKDREAWRGIVHGVAKSQTQLSDFTFTFFIESRKMVLMSLFVGQE